MSTTAVDEITYGYMGDFVRKDRDRKMVWSVITGPKVDLDMQRCDPMWLREAVPKWMKRGNVRQMHSTQLPPAGKAVEAIENSDSEWVGGFKVVNKDAWELVDEGVYTGVSIGVRNAHISDDPTGVAKYGVIDAGDIVEVSFVDYPAYQYSELKTDRASLIKRADVRKAVEIVGVEPVPTAAVAALVVPTVKYAHPSVIVPGKTNPADAIKLGGTALESPPVGPDGLPADAEKGAAWGVLVKADSKKPYGDVEYADPGYQEDGKHRYPLDTEAHIRSAWSYINQDDNASKYSSDDLAKVKRKIKAAMKRIGAEVSDDKAAGAEERPIAQDDDEEHDMDDPNLTSTRGRKVPSETHVDPGSTAPDVVTLATLPDGTKIQTSRKDLGTSSGLQEPNLNGKAADDGTQSSAELAHAAHSGRASHEHTHQTANAAHGVDAGDSHSHEHEHDDSADHDVAPHPDYGGKKAAEPETTKADDGVQLGGDEAQHNTALNQARAAIKALISQELAEDEAEVDCVQQLTSIWNQLEWWAQNEAAEAAGVGSLGYAYWEAVATLAKHNTAKTAKAWAPALIAAGESLMTQAKAAETPEQPETKAVEPEVEKEGRTISSATAAALLDIAGATGMPADAAARLRALAGETVHSPNDNKQDGTTGDPTGIEPIPMRIDPETLQLTSREATGADAGPMQSSAFDRSSAPPVRTSAADPDLLKNIDSHIADVVGQVLKVVLPEALKGVAPVGAVAKAADAVEATHEDAVTKIAQLRDELTKVAGLPDQWAAHQKLVDDELASIKKLADGRVPVATGDLRTVEKQFVGNNDETDDTVKAGRAIFEQAMAGDPDAQAKLRKAFASASRDVAQEAYVSTAPHRG